MARSHASADNTTITWKQVHVGTVATSIAMDLFGNAYFDLNGYGVYEYSVYPGYTKRAAFGVVGLGLGR